MFYILAVSNNEDQKLNLQIAASRISSRKFRNFTFTDIDAMT